MNLGCRRATTSPAPLGAAAPAFFGFDFLKTALRIMSPRSSSSLSMASKSIWSMTSYASSNTGRQVEGATLQKGRNKGEGSGKGTADATTYRRDFRLAKQRVENVVLAAAGIVGQDIIVAANVVVSRTPGTHVEPVGRAARHVCVARVQQNKLLLRALCQRFQLLRGKRCIDEVNAASGRESSHVRSKGQTTPQQPCVQAYRSLGGANFRLLGSQANDKDAVGLANAAARPACQVEVALVQDKVVLVLLHGEPAAWGRARE